MASAISSSEYPRLFSSRAPRWAGVKRSSSAATASCSSWCAASSRGLQARLSASGRVVGDSSSASDLEADHPSVPVVLVEACVGDRLVQELGTISGQVVGFGFRKKPKVAVVDDILCESPIAQQRLGVGEWRGSVARIQASCVPLELG